MQNKLLHTAINKMKINWPFAIKWKQAKKYALSCIPQINMLASEKYIDSSTE